MNRSPTTHDRTPALTLETMPINLIAGLLGGALLVWGARRNTAARITAGVSGAALLASALVRSEWERQRGLTARTSVGVPADRVVEFWHHYEDETPAAPRRPTHQAVGS